MARRRARVRSRNALLLTLAAGIAIAAVGCSRERTSSSLPIARTGPEEWNIDDAHYSIVETYFVDLPEGLQYTIVYACDLPNDLRSIGREAALVAAFPIMAHAYESGRYRRVAVSSAGRGQLAVERIGVVFRRRDREEGYRVALPLSEISSRLEEGFLRKRQAPPFCGAPTSLR